METVDIYYSIENETKYYFLLEDNCKSFRSYTLQKGKSHPDEHLNLANYLGVTTEQINFIEK